MPAGRVAIPLGQRKLDWVLVAFFAVNLFFITYFIDIMTIWIDVIWNGPFYVFAIYAIIRGREWIRVPALVWCGSMAAVVLIILSEEYNGVHRAPHFLVILALNLPWLLLPLATLVRMAGAHPFSRPAVIEPAPMPAPASP